MPQAQPAPVPLAEWLTELRAALNASDPRLQLTPAEERELLELARVAAHASERIAAPLTTFVAGVALAEAAPAERATRVRDLIAALKRVADQRVEPRGGKA
jgi:hypothetical protein